MNQQLQETLAQILKAMQSAGAEYGPKALELALAIRRVEGIAQLVYGLVALLIVLGMAALLKRWRQLALDTAEEINDPIPMVIWACGVLATLAVLPSAGRLVNIWNWVAVVNPGLALAHDLLLKVTGK